MQLAWMTFPLTSKENVLSDHTIVNCICDADAIMDIFNEAPPALYDYSDYGWLVRCQTGRWRSSDRSRGQRWDAAGLWKLRHVSGMAGLYKYTVKS